MITCLRNTGAWILPVVALGPSGSNRTQVWKKIVRLIYKLQCSDLCLP